VAPVPVAADRRQHRGEAERAEHAGVCEQPGAEAGDRAEHRAAQQCDTHQRDEQEVRVAAEDRDVRHDRELQHDREEEQAGCLRQVGRHHGAFGIFLFVIRAVTASSDEKSTNGSIWICLYGAVSLCPTLVTTPIGMSAGKSDGYCFERLPAVTITSPTDTCLSFVT